MQQQQNQIKRHRDRHQSRERESFKERRNDLEHKARENDLQSKKTKCFSNCCCSRKVVYILTERAPEGLALREISTPESLKAGENQYQREASTSDEKGLEVIRNSVLVTYGSCTIEEKVYVPNSIAATAAHQNAA